MSLTILQNVNLADYTSWLVGGEAQYFCLPATIQDLQEALGFAHSQKIAFTILGGGSNVLVSDQGIAGLVICLKKLSGVVVKEQGDRLFISALAGTSKSELLKIFLKAQLSPALFLAGLPGDVGGGVVMNAGVAESFYPREFMELVDSIEVMNSKGEIRSILKDDLQISYRHTSGFQPDIVIKANMSWTNEKQPDVLNKVRDANKIRLTKQPLDMPSCGSVFKNPDGLKAAQLIDQCGLKGYRIGDAQVSLKHANFIVNLGKAKASDIWSVIQHVKSQVKKNKNVDLVTEVVRLGYWPDKD